MASQSVRGGGPDEPRGAGVARLRRRRHDLDAVHTADHEAIDRDRPQVHVFVYRLLTGFLRSEATEQIIVAVLVYDHTSVVQNFDDADWWFTRPVDTFEDVKGTSGVSWVIDPRLEYLDSHVLTYAGDNGNHGSPTRLIGYGRY